MKIKLSGGFMLIAMLLLTACSNPSTHDYKAETYTVTSPVSVIDEAICDAEETAYQPAENEANYNPFASALYSFFADAIPAPAFEDFYGDFMPYSTHAVLVGLDSNGTQGVIASRWVQGQHPRPRFEQYLLWLCNGELRKEAPIFFRFNRTPAGRLVAMDEIGACNITVQLWTLLDFADGELSFTKAAAMREYWALGWMLGDYDDPDYLHTFGTYYNLRTYINGNPWDIRYQVWEETPLTYEEFQDMMMQYGLHDITNHVWQLPDQTQAILYLPYEEYSALSLFQAVLKDIQPFYNDYFGLIYLSDLPYEYPQPTNIAIFDMNGDGVPEVIVNLQNIIILVLRYYEGNVYGHEFGIRSMNSIKTDGTFSNSGGSGSWGIAALEFAGGIYEYISIYQYDFIWNEDTREGINKINGLEVSDEEVEAILNAQNAQESIAFHPFSEETIQNLALLITPRYVPSDYETTQETEQDLHIHWDNGIIQYASRIEGNVRILYAVENNGTNMREIAVFPSLNAEWGHAETEWCRPQEIFHFDVIDDWIILSAGEIQGSMRNFFGDLHRVRRDGSEREAFQLWSMNNRFTVADGWIYHHIWDVQEIYGWIRIRPDGTDRQFMGDTIYTIISFAEDGYFYGTHTASGRDNLARWQPESN
ncbi:MAG: hypothetical protein FWD03_04830, partial [Defluviitaleaceae bacterium]|nr:hypothetical protein [Defluviitaleaceae bacterium]